MTRERVTVPAIRSSKVISGHEPISMITAYDYPSAKMVDQSGADIILVGDSLAMVVLGHKDTLNLTLEDMVYHTRAVIASDPRALVIVDMPWMTYHTSENEAIVNASKLIRAGASAVKLEGGSKRCNVIRALCNAEIPVMGHIGLTPQSIRELGGFKVQARTDRAADQLITDALALQEAGVFSIVLEAIPELVARRVTGLVEVPTIGIGAGAGCDGQVLVFHDILGFNKANRAKFVKTYGDIESLGIEALSQFVKDVKTQQFPTRDHVYQGSSTQHHSAI